VLIERDISSEGDIQFPIQAPVKPIVDDLALARCSDLSVTFLPFVVAL
jgi:hypothetical protein